MIGYSAIVGVTLGNSLDYFVLLYITHCDYFTFLMFFSFRCGNVHLCDGLLGPKGPGHEQLHLAMDQSLYSESECIQSIMGNVENNMNAIRWSGFQAAVLALFLFLAYLRI